MSFLTARKFLGAKVESVRYTAETLAETDYDLPAYNIAYTSTIDQYERAVNLSNFSKLTNVPGKSMATCSFSVDVAIGEVGDLSTVPSWGKLLKACGMRQDEMAGGVGWVTDSTECTTLTMEIADTEECSSPSQRVVQLSGCVGTVAFVVDQVGNPVRMDFTFTGQINSVFDRASAFSSTNVLTTTPDSVLSATVEAGGYTDIDLNSLNMNINLDVQMEVDPSDSSGYKGAHIVNRTPEVSIDPYLHTYAERDWYAQNLNPDANLNDFTFATSNFVYYFKQLQVVNSLQDGDRNGLVTESITFKSVAAPADDEFYLLQGISG
jgi:hypothetical protein